MSATQVLETKVQRAFSGDIGEDLTREVLAELRASQRDLESRMRKTVVSTALLTAAFFILLSGNVAEASLSFVKLKDLTPIVAALPVLIAYLAHTYTANLIDVTHLVYLHDQIIKNRYPDLYDNDIEMFLAPPSSVLHRAYRLRILLPGAVGQAYAFATFIIPFVSLLGCPAVLLGYSSSKIIHLEGVPRPVLIASIGLTAAFTLFAILEVALPLWSKKRGWRPWHRPQGPDVATGRDSTEDIAIPPARQGRAQRPALPSNSESDG